MINIYFNSLSQIKGIQFMPEPKGSISNRWLTTLTIHSIICGITPLELIKVLDKENIEARPVWKPMHQQPLYNKYDYIISSNDDISGELFSSGICLPSDTNLCFEQQS